MVGLSYDSLIGKISQLSGLPQEEINRMIEAKRARLSHLISKEGAAQIVAAELGISFDNQLFKVNELVPGMRKVRVLGKLIQIFPVRSFEKNGRSGKVLNCIIADETANIRIVFWDLNHISLFESNQLQLGDCVEISNASMREQELHLNSFSEIKKSDITISNPKTEREVHEKKLSDVHLGDSIISRAFVVQAFGPTTFAICPQCKKRCIVDNEIASCEEHGVVIPEKRNIITLILDDGSATLRTVLFHNQVQKLFSVEGLPDENAYLLKESILGKEYVFQGLIKQNKLFQTPELTVQEISPINIPLVIQSLERKSVRS